MSNWDTAIELLLKSCGHKCDGKCGHKHKDKRDVSKSWQEANDLLKGDPVRSKEGLGPKTGALSPQIGAGLKGAGKGAFRSLQSVKDAALKAAERAKRAREIERINIAESTGDWQWFPEKGKPISKQQIPSVRPPPGQEKAVLEEEPVSRRRAVSPVQVAALTPKQEKKFGTPIVSPRQRGPKDTQYAQGTYQAFDAPIGGRRKGGPKRVGGAVEAGVAARLSQAMATLGRENPALYRKFKSEIAGPALANAREFFWRKRMKNPRARQAAIKLLSQKSNISVEGASKQIAQRIAAGRKAYSKYMASGGATPYGTFPHSGYGGHHKTARAIDFLYGSPPNPSKAKTATSTWAQWYPGKEKILEVLNRHGIGFSRMTTPQEAMKDPASGGRAIATHLGGHLEARDPGSRREFRITKQTPRDVKPGAFKSHIQALHNKGQGRKIRSYIRRAGKNLPSYLRPMLSELGYI